MRIITKVYIPRIGYTQLDAYITKYTKSCIHTGFNTKLAYETKKTSSRRIRHHFRDPHFCPWAGFSRRIINKVYKHRIGYTQLDAYILKYTKTCTRTGFNAKFVCVQKNHPQCGFDAISWTHSLPMSGVFREVYNWGVQTPHWLHKVGCIYNKVYENLHPHWF